MLYREALRRFKVEYFTKVLYEARGNVSQAARLAGTNRTDFYEQLRRLGIKNPCRSAQPWRKGLQ